jgi:hypothetical protein
MLSKLTVADSLIPWWIAIELESCCPSYLQAKGSCSKAAETEADKVRRSTARDHGGRRAVALKGQQVGE